MLRAIGDPSFDFVWPSNWRYCSGILTDMIAVKPSLTSVPSRFLSFVFKKLYFLAYSLKTFVNPDLNPISWVPPSLVLTRLTKETIFSWYPSVNCKANSTSISLLVSSILITLEIAFLSLLIHSIKASKPLS